MGFGERRDQRQTNHARVFDRRLDPADRAEGVLADVHVAGRHSGREVALIRELALGETALGACPADHHRGLGAKDRAPQLSVQFGVGSLVEEDVDADGAGAGGVRCLDPLRHQRPIDRRAITHLFLGHRVLADAKDHDILAKGLDRNQRCQPDVGKPVLHQHGRRKTAWRGRARGGQQRRQRAEREHLEGAPVEKHRSPPRFESRGFYTARRCRRHLRPPLLRHRRRQRDKGGGHGTGALGRHRRHRQHMHAEGAQSAAWETV